MQWCTLDPNGDLRRKRRFRSSRGRWPFERFCEWRKGSCAAGQREGAVHHSFRDFWTAYIWVGNRSSLVAFKSRYKFFIQSQPDGIKSPSPKIPLCTALGGGGRRQSGREQSRRRNARAPTTTAAPKKIPRPMSRGESGLVHVESPSRERVASQQQHYNKLLKQCYEVNIVNRCDSPNEIMTLS